MPYLYLVSAVVLMSILNIFGAGFNRTEAGKQKNVTPFYNFLLCSAACITWGVIYLCDFSFEPRVLVYSAIFGVCYAGIAITSIKALAEGPTLLTTLLQQLSLIGVTVWGFARWDTWDVKMAPIVLTGLALVVVSLVLSLYSGEKSGKKITLKWLVYASVMFVVTASSSIVQKEEQNAFHGEHGSMFMFFGVFLAMLICLGYFLLTEKPDTRKMLQTAWYYPVGAGMSSSLGNLFVVLMATKLSSNLVYPTLAVGCLALTSVGAVVLFKEKLAWWQWIGVAVGAVAVALLSIT